MARVRYVPDGASPSVDELYGMVGRLGRPVLNLYRVLANQPAALRAFLEMSAYVRSSSSLDPRLRELVILATAHALSQEYEIVHHTEIADRVGVPKSTIAAVAAGGSLEELEPAEQTAVEFARAVAVSRACDDATFARLRSHFSDAAVIDLVVTTAWYHLCAVVLGSLEVELEAEGR